MKYSTIQLSIYQQQEIRRELLPNDKNIEAFRPGIGTQLWDATQFGWSIFEMIIIFIARLWGAILFLAIVFILIRVYMRRQIPVRKEEETEKK